MKIIPTKWWRESFLRAFYYLLNCDVTSTCSLLLRNNHDQSSIPLSLAMQSTRSTKHYFPLTLSSEAIAAVLPFQAEFLLQLHLFWFVFTESSKASSISESSWLAFANIEIAIVCSLFSLLFCVLVGLSLRCYPCLYVLISPFLLRSSALYFAPRRPCLPWPVRCVLRPSFYWFLARNPSRPFLLLRQATTNEWTTTTHHQTKQQQKTDKTTKQTATGNR